MGRPHRPVTFLYKLLFSDLFRRYFELGSIAGHGRSGIDGLDISFVQFRLGGGCCSPVDAQFAGIRDLVHGSTRPGDIRGGQDTILQWPGLPDRGFECKCDRQWRGGDHHGNHRQ